VLLANFQLLPLTTRALKRRDPVANSEEQTAPKNPFLNEFKRHLSAVSLSTKPAIWVR
jgi:hypothetical protein